MAYERGFGGERRRERDYGSFEPRREARRYEGDRPDYEGNREERFPEEAEGGYYASRGGYEGYGGYGSHERGLRGEDYEGRGRFERELDVEREPRYGDWRGRDRAGWGGEYDDRRGYEADWRDRDRDYADDRFDRWDADERRVYGEGRDFEREQRFGEGRRYEAETRQRQGRGLEHRGRGQGRGTGDDRGIGGRGAGGGRGRSRTGQRR